MTATLIGKLPERGRDMPKATIQVTFRLDKEEYDELRQEVAVTGGTITAWIASAIREKAERDRKRRGNSGR